MIIESGTTLIASLQAAVAVNQLQCSMSYADHSYTNAQFLPATQYALTSGTARVSLVSMPSSGTQRQVKHVSIYNADTSTATVFVYKLVSDVSYTIMAQGLNPGETVWYGSDSGWHSRNSGGGEEVYTNFISISTNNVAGTWTSDVSASNITVSKLSVTRILSTALYPDGAVAAPSRAFSSETSLGFYRSANSTLRQSYGTFWPTAIWVDSGVSAIGSTGSFSGLNVASTISCSGLTVSSIATVSRLSSAVSVVAVGVWTSNLSVGNATAGGTIVTAISSISSKIPATTVQASGTSLYTITWTGVQPGDVVICGPILSAASSAISQALQWHSHCTIANRFEFRYSNVSTLVAVQSAQTFNFIRISA